MTRALLKPTWPVTLRAWLPSAVLLLLAAIPFETRLALAEPVEAPGCAIFGMLTASGVPIPGDVRVMRRHTLEEFEREHARRAGWVLDRLRSPQGEGLGEWRAVAAADGTYRVTGLPPGFYWISGTDLSGRAGGARVRLEIDGQHMDVPIELRLTDQELHGRIDWVGGPPPGALLVVTSGDPPWGYRNLPQTADERFVSLPRSGSFQLRGLPRGSTHLSVCVPGQLFLDVAEVVLPLREPLVVALDPGSAMFRGAVVDADSGEPLADARIAWWGAGPAGWAAGVARSDRTGQFAVGYVAFVRRLSNVYVECPRYDKLSWDWTPYRQWPERRFPLRRGARLEGIVVAETGCPVAGVVVSPHYVSRGGRTSPVPVRTGDDGRFVFDDLTWGDVVVHARGSGWVPAAYEPMDLYRRQDSEAHDPLRWWLEPGRSSSIRLVVKRGSVLAGTVVDAQGRPLEGAAIRLGSDNDPEWGWNGHEAYASAATDKLGGFRVEGLFEGGRYDVELSAPGFPMVEAKDLSPASDIRLVVSTGSASATPSAGQQPQGEAGNRPRWILLTVVDAVTGQPIPDVEIDAMIDVSPGSSKRHERSWTTDAEGKARLGPLVARTGSMQLDCKGYLERTMVPFPMPTAEGTLQTVALEPKQTIRGRVLLPDGKPAASGTVHVEGIDGLGNMGTWAVAESGEFFVDDLRRVPYKLAAQLVTEACEYTAEAEARGGDQSVVLRLVEVPGSREERAQPKRTLRILLPDGRPVPRARFAPSTKRGGSEVVNGSITLDPAPTAPFAVDIEDARAEDGYRLPVKRLHLAAVSPHDVPAEIRLEPERVVWGRVEDPDGNAVAQAWVRALLPGTAKRGHDSSDAHASATTGPEGRFRLGTLSDTAYVLEVTAPAGLAGPGTPTKLDVNTSEVAIRLHRLVRIEIVLEDADGKPLADVEVRTSKKTWKHDPRRTGVWERVEDVGWYEDDVAHHRSKTDRSGRAVLRAVDPEQVYDLHIDGPRPGSLEEWRQWKPWRRDGWIPRDEVIRLPNHDVAPK